MNAAAPFLEDVPALLEQSLPRPGLRRLLYAGAIFLLLVMISTFLVRRSAALEALVGQASFLLMVLLMIVMPLIMFWSVRRQRREQQQIEAIHELVQLRRWNEAAELLQSLLSRPVRQMPMRTQALLYLSSVLARYERFADAILVQEHLLAAGLLDEAGQHAVRLGRAMALLRDGRLSDANSALAELRRSPGAEQSGGLALIELYRDVQTGHAEEAIEIFNRKLELIKSQLGVRLGDACGLAAAALDRLGREDEAREHYRRATLLSVPHELHRRYPETAALAAKYEAAAPPEGA